MEDQLLGCGPILCAHLLRRVDEKLIELLGALTPDEWDLQTIAPAWKVRDVAAHLLDTPLRKLSLVRDSWQAEAVEIRSHEDVIALVNRLNREGVNVYRRLSPAVMIDLMKLACEQNARFHEGLDPFATAQFAVSWAGEASSLNWFDTARELTERWHHQQQIRLATGRDGIMTPELYRPVLDCFLRGLPHALRDTAACEGHGLAVEITGECGGRWLLRRTAAKWEFAARADAGLSRVGIPQEAAWRIFTKGLDRAAAWKLIEIEGDRVLAEKILDLTAIVG